jgi:two-component system OmpR family response regulator
MHLLLAEDDRILRECISESLIDAGFTVDCQADGQIVDAALSNGRYDALILDLGLPGLDGMEVLKRMRARNLTLPVLVITARDSIEDKVSGLNIGADDYLTKPFALAELEVRVKSLLRRSSWRDASKPTKEDPSSSGGVMWSIDRESGVVTINEGKIELPPAELVLLDKLLLRMGRVVTKDELVKALSPEDHAVGVNSVEVYVHRIRKRIENTGLFIKTVRGVGYRLDMLS